MLISARYGGVPPTLLFVAGQQESKTQSPNGVFTVCVFSPIVAITTKGGAS